VQHALNCPKQDFWHSKAKAVSEACKALKQRPFIRCGPGCKIFGGDKCEDDKTSPENHKWDWKSPQVTRKMDKAEVDENMRAANITAKQCEVVPPSAKAKRARQAEDDEEHSASNATGNLIEGPPTSPTSKRIRHERLAKQSVQRNCPIIFFAGNFIHWRGHPKSRCCFAR
jgi:hypothetical protein